ncbi:MAG TPA: hypothetical protein VGS28_04055 [Candidatus Saccharimonadales bacterium]|nr:hypothetical protein [Candidatus Saccharimonadales bacterium]
MSGISFTVTQPTLYLAGYWWWVASGQSTSAQKFCLWSLGDGLNAVVPNSTVTSGTLTSGQWNYVPLATPIPLSERYVHVAATGFSNNFSETKNQFGSGDPYSAGITNGPLMAYSDSTGSAVSPVANQPQGSFSIGGTDPTVNMPNQSDTSANLWIDVQITDVVPAGATYRLFPSSTAPWLLGGSSGNFTLTTQIAISQPVTVEKLWYYSGAGMAVLPSRCGLFSTTSQTEVAGSDNSSPSWKLPGGGAAAAGSGWVYVDYSSSGLQLQPGGYQVAVYASSGSNWFTYTSNYWNSSSPFVSGNSGAGNGPISAPSSVASLVGQCAYFTGAWGYPNTNSNGANWWIDLEVMPASNPGAFFSVFGL